jgi:hypothetical protein
MMRLRRTSSNQVYLLCAAMAVGQFVPAFQSASASRCDAKTATLPSCCSRRAMSETKASSPQRSCCKSADKSQTKERENCSHCQAKTQHVAAIDRASMLGSECCCRSKAPTPAIPVRVNSPVRKIQPMQALLDASDHWRIQPDRGQEVASVRCALSSPSPPLWLMHCAHLA